MNPQSLRAQIAQTQTRLAELASQLDGLTKAEVEALAVEFIPLLIRFNTAPSQMLSPLFRLTFDQYRTILDAISAGILVYDAQQVIRFVNKKAIQYIGYDPTGEARDRYMQRIRLSDWSGRPMSIYDRPANLVWEGVLARDVQMMITTQAGQIFQVLVTAIPLMQDEQFTGAVVIWNDVTQLEQAILEIKLREEQLRESEARFRIALANASIFVFTLDLNLRYTWLYAPEDPEEAQRAIGKRNDEIVPEADMRELEDLKRQVIQTGMGVRKEMALMLHGRQRVFDMSFEPLRDNRGQITGLTGAAVDITEQRHLEARQNEYAARMELHHRLVELREQDLLHFAQKLNDDILQGLISQIADIQMMREISHESQMAEMIADLEGRARELADRLRSVVYELNPPAATRFGLKRAITAHIQDLQKRYPGITFELNLMEDILKLPEAVCLSLYRIYRDAIENAIQHAAASRIIVQLIFEAKEISLQIIDDGVGFVPSTNWMEMIKNGQFGLVSMKEQAETICGKFALTSTPGQGTLVSVTAPYSE